MPNIAEGILQQVWAKPQSVFDTVEAYVADDAVSPVRGTLKIEPFLNFEEHKEAVGTASLQGENQLNQGGKWSGQFYLKPNAAGTAPDIGPALLFAAMGVSTNTPATSEVYTLSDTVKTGFQMVQNIASNFQHMMSGAWVEQMSIEIAGNGMPLFTFSGGFASFGWAYETVVGVGGMAGTDTECPLDNDDRGSSYIGAVVNFESQGATAYTITGIDWTAGSAHFDFLPALPVAPGGDVAAGEAITAFVPSATRTGSILSSVECGLTIDTIALGFINAKIVLDTGIKGLDKEATYDRPNRLARAERRVSGEIEFYFLDSATGNSAVLGRAWDGTTRDIDIRVGADTSAKRMSISLPKTRLEVAVIEPPEAEETNAVAKFKAHQNAAAADEMVVTFD